jgi:PAS domain S-box-containing protein
MKNEEGGSGETNRRQENEAGQDLRMDPDETSTGLMEQLVEELRVHQLELDMQNDELRRSQLALEESKNKYGELYDLAPVGYLICNSEGLIQNANLTIASMVNLPKASLSGTPVTKLIHRDDQDIFHLHRKRILQTEASQLLDLRIAKSDGVFFYAQLNLRLQAQADRLLITVTDLSPLKNAQRKLEQTYKALETQVAQRTVRLESTNKELKALVVEKARIAEALKESETRYRSLLESTDDFIYLLNENGEYLFMNARTRKQYGLSPDQVKGRHYGEFHDEVDTKVFVEQIRRIYRNKGSLLYEHPGPNRRYYLRTLSPVREPDGAVSAVTVVSKEITDQKNLETALIKSNEKLRQEQSRRIALSKRLINLLEEERHRISRDLHDHVGQVLTSLKIDLEIILPAIPAENSALSKKIAQAAVKAGRLLRDIKTISAQLRPGILDDFGLERSIAQLLKELEQKGMETKFFCRSVPKRFNPEKELALYRIAQEAFQNIMKHARARKIHVALTKRKETLCLSIEDDGASFNPEKSMASAEGQKPLGLIIMRERAFQQGGELTIDAAEGRGTLILAEIPL